MYKVSTASFGNRNYYSISWQALMHARVSNYFLVINGINVEIARYFGMKFAIDKEYLIILCNLIIMLLNFTKLIFMRCETQKNIFPAQVRVYVFEIETAYL